MKAKILNGNYGVEYGKIIDVVLNKSKNTIAYYVDDSIYFLAGPDGFWETVDEHTSNNNENKKHYQNDLIGLLGEKPSKIEITF